MAVPDDWNSTFLATRGPQALTLAGSLNPLAEVSSFTPGYQVPLRRMEGGFVYPGFGVDPELQATGYLNPPPTVPGPVGIDWGQVDTTGGAPARTASNAGGAGAAGSPLAMMLAGRLIQPVARLLADQVKRAFEGGGSGEDLPLPPDAPLDDAGNPILDADGRATGIYASPQPTAAEADPTLLPQQDHGAPLVGSGGVPAPSITEASPGATGVETAALGASPAADIGAAGPPPQVNVDAGAFSGTSEGGGMAANYGSTVLTPGADPFVQWAGNTFGDVGTNLASGLSMAPFAMVGGQWGKALATMFSGNDFTPNQWTSMGGAPAGAAIGTAIMPGIGTLIGSFVGALAGNLIGEATKHPQSFIGGGITIGADGRAHLDLSQPGAHDGGNASVAGRLRTALDLYLNGRAGAEGMAWNPEASGSYNFLTGTYEDQLFFRSGHTNPITGETDPTMQSVGNKQNPGAFFGNHFDDFEIAPQIAWRWPGLASSIYSDLLAHNVLVARDKAPTWADVASSRNDYQTWRNANSRETTGYTGGENWETTIGRDYDMPWGYTAPGDEGADWRTGGDPTWNDYQGFRDSEAYQQWRAGDRSAESLTQLRPTAGDSSRVQQQAESYEQRHPELLANRTENFAGGG